MGAVFAVNTSMATLLAIIIGLQNLPEAFNAFRDLVLSGMTIKKTLMTFFVLSFLGIPTALFGHYVLSNSATITAQLMTFASGGILYLLIQDIIPASKLKSNYITALGATVGFLVGIVGSKIV
jgi:ZIP family zinc transporter